MREIPPPIEHKLEKKRFVLNPDRFSRERLGRLREILQALKAEYPAVVSASLYGSMTKGYAELESDIDIILFLDPKQIPEENPDYDQVIAKSMQERLSEVDISSDYKVHKIDEEIIDEGLESSEQVRKNLNIPDSADTFPLLGDRYQLLKDLFLGLSLDKGLKKYRAYLIKKLISQGENGQKVWNGFMDSVRMFERDLEEDDGSYKDLYPYSLKEAKEIWLDSPCKN